MKTKIIYCCLFLAGIWWAGCSGPTSANHAGEEANDTHEEGGHGHEEEGHEEEGGHEHGEEMHVELSPEQAKRMALPMVKFEMKEMGSGIAVNGKLDVPPQSLVSVSVPFGGFLRSTELLPGSRVRKGEVIATLEDPFYLELQQQYWETKSQWTYFKSDYERQQALATTQATAVKHMEKARADYERATATMNGLKAKLALLHIYPEKLEHGTILQQVQVRAPINGHVAHVDANIGSYVKPSDVLFRLVDTEHLHVELQVYEKDIARVKKGQSIRFQLASDEAEMKGEVFLVGKEVDETRTVSVHGHLEHGANHKSTQAELIPGMYLSAVIETGTQPVMTLPETALLRHEGAIYIFVQTEPNTFEMVPVEVGGTSLGFAEVRPPEGFDTKLSIVKAKGYALLSMLKNTESGHAH